MTSLTGVLDSDTVIGTAKGGVWELLRSLYQALYVPPGVVQEVTVDGRGLPGAAELSAALGQWVTLVVPDPARVQQYSSSLSVADREVLAVAQELSVDHILTNDFDLRREVSRQQLVSLQVPLLVALLKTEGHIPEVRPVLDRMRQQGFGIDEASYQDALQTAGEASRRRRRKR